MNELQKLTVITDKAYRESATYQDESKPKRQRSALAIKEYKDIALTTLKNVAKEIGFAPDKIQVVSSSQVINEFTIQAPATFCQALLERHQTEPVANIEYLLTAKQMNETFLDRN